MLDNNKKTATLAAGYYNGANIATSMTLNGKVSYTHHVHSIVNKSTTKVDESFESGEAYGSEISSVQGGCYTTANYTGGGRCGAGSTTIAEWEEGRWDEGQGRHMRYVKARCSNGHVWTTSWDNGGPGQGAGSCPVNMPPVLTGYSASCGYTSGQIIKAEIIY